MSRKKLPVPGSLKTFVVFDQQRAIKKEGRNGEPYYEANIVRVGEIQATHAGEALDLAKRKRMSPWPMIWGEETEQKREKYKRKFVRDDE